MFSVEANDSYFEIPILSFSISPKTQNTIQIIKHSNGSTYTSLVMLPDQLVTWSPGKEQILNQRNDIVFSATERVEFARVCFIMPHLHDSNFKLPCTFREKIFGFSFFLVKNKLPSKFLQTKREFSKKSEYLPSNWDVSDFHQKLNFTLIDSILLLV